MKTEYKIIADHLRSSCFLIADGILPSNEGRGYVLRRIMRRAMRQLHKLGAKEASMYKFVDILIKEMGEAYPELSQAYDLIVETLKNEEEKFRETLDKGLKILSQEIENSKDSKLDGKIAFKLYDTYGFPLDLTQDIAKEYNLEFDQTSFNHEMEQQRQRARQNWAGSGEESEDKLFFNLKEQHGATKFIGYDNLESESTILAIQQIAATKESIIILDKTPFYATAGGQQGDDGIISYGDNIIKITKTKKFAGDLFVHFTQDITTNFKAGDKITAKINYKNRQARACNHSATHLMHKALQDILGNSITQKGSNVDVESFTFDFNFNRAVTDKEIEQIENSVNQAIQNNHPSLTKLMSLEDAKTSGAMALFGEKYDDNVRVVNIGNSTELCGGTHVKNSGEIALFKIISEGSIASGIRRITAQTGQFAIDYYREKQQKQQNSIENLTKDLKQKDKEIEQLKKQILLSKLKDIKATKIGNFNLVAQTFSNIEAKDIREISNSLKKQENFKNNTIFALFSHKENKVAICLALSQDLLEKLDASKLITNLVPQIGGKGGGGKKDMAMGGGNNKDGINQAIELLKDQLIKE